MTLRELVEELRGITGQTLTERSRGHSPFSHKKILKGPKRTLKHTGKYKCKCNQGHCTCKVRGGGVKHTYEPPEAKAKRNRAFLDRLEGRASGKATS